VDELETLLEYAPVGPRYSNNVLQTLKLLFKRPPPKGRKLLIIATTTYRDILDQLGLLASFSKVIHLSNMSTGEHILHALTEIEHCFNDQEMRYLEKKLQDKKYRDFYLFRFRMIIFFLVEYALELNHYWI
jgi:vesicle-fusing ATPase